MLHVSVICITNGTVLLKGNTCLNWKNMSCIFLSQIVGRFYPFLQATKAFRESRGIALLCFYLDLGTRRGWGVSVTPWPLSNPRKNLVPIVQEAGWAPGPVWTGAENLATTGIFFNNLYLPSVQWVKYIDQEPWVVAASVVWWLACWFLVPKFAGSNLAEAVRFFGRKNPQHSFLRRGSKAFCPMSQLCGILKNPTILWNSQL
jgi:hypothetical protein